MIEAYTFSSGVFVFLGWGFLFKAEEACARFDLILDQQGGTCSSRGDRVKTTAAGSSPNKYGNI